MPLPVSSPRKPVVDGFPSRARIALAYVLEGMRDQGYLLGEKDVIRELNRIGRLTSADIGTEKNKTFLNRVAHRLQLLEWDQVLLFCERVYEKLLTSVEYGFEYIGLEEVRQDFENEVNQILDEENIAFYFQEGKFQRKGRPQTWRSFEEVGKVLDSIRKIGKGLKKKA